MLGPARHATISAPSGEVGPLVPPIAKPRRRRRLTAQTGSTRWSRTAASVDQFAPSVWLSAPYWLAMARVSSARAVGEKRPGTLLRPAISEDSSPAR